MKDVIVFYPYSIERIVARVITTIGLILVALGFLIDCFGSTDFMPLVLGILGIAFLLVRPYLSDDVAIILKDDDIIAMVPHKSKIKCFKWSDFSHACYSHDRKGRRSIILSDKKIDINDKGVKRWINSGDPLFKNSVLIGLQMSTNKADAQKVHAIIKEHFPNVDQAEELNTCL